MDATVKQQVKPKPVKKQVKPKPVKQQVKPKPVKKQKVKPVTSSKLAANLQRVEAQYHLKHAGAKAVAKASNTVTGNIIAKTKPQKKVTKQQVKQPKLAKKVPVSDTGYPYPGTHAYIWK